MLYIVCGQSQLVWYVGGQKPKVDPIKITEIQADGHELGAILEQFENLPRHKSSAVQKWFGDHAKHIWANLR